jgi:hypothetical protein
MPASPSLSDAGRPSIETGANLVTSGDRIKRDPSRTLAIVGMCAARGDHDFIFICRRILPAVQQDVGIRQ